MTENITLRFLGTGTSTGVPAMDAHVRHACRPTPATSVCAHRPLCRWAIKSADRLRARFPPPDYRCGSTAPRSRIADTQPLRPCRGIDDMRPYCHSLPDGHFPVYCTADVAEDLRNRVPYCFRENLYPGVPVFSIHEVDPKVPFMVGDIQVTPLPVMHDRLPIIGFRIGPLAYITDAKTIPESTFSLLEGVDTLVINALRHVPHHSHMSVGEALAVVDRLKPRAVYFTHIADALGPHALGRGCLPPPVRLAYDGLSISFKL